MKKKEVKMHENSNRKLYSLEEVKATLKRTVADCAVRKAGKAFCLLPFSTARSNPADSPDVLVRISGRYYVQCGHLSLFSDIDEE